MEALVPLDTETANQFFDVHAVLIEHFLLLLMVVPMKYTMDGVVNVINIACVCSRWCDLTKQILVKIGTPRLCVKDRNLENLALRASWRIRPSIREDLKRKQAAYWHYEKSIQFYVENELATSHISRMLWFESKFKLADGYDSTQTRGEYIFKYAFAKKKFQYIRAITRDIWENRQHRAISCIPMLVNGFGFKDDEYSFSLFIADIFLTGDSEQREFALRNFTQALNRFQRNTTFDPLTEEENKYLISWRLPPAETRITTTTTYTKYSTVAQRIKK